MQAEKANEINGVCALIKGAGLALRRRAGAGD